MQINQALRTLKAQTEKAFEDFRTNAEEIASTEADVLFKNHVAVITQYLEKIFVDTTKEIEAIIIIGSEKP